MKFLLVILTSVTSTAVAVMFTFSFSSAFAAVNYATATFSYDQAVAELQKVAKDVTDDAQERMATALAAYPGASDKYSKDAAKVALQKAYEEGVAETNKALDNQALYDKVVAGEITIVFS